MWGTINIVPHSIFMDNPGPALLIDARNALYRAIYAVKADTRHAVKYHYFVIFLRQLASWINRYKPSSVHVFWDAPRQTVWRRKILPTYKDRSTSHYVEDIAADIAMTTEVAQAFLKHMNVRQYSKAAMEADDLIYAATSVLHPHPSVIISTDSDMIQIPFCYSSSRVYDPKEHEEVAVPTHHPAIIKALTGDKADSIDGYYGIGPKKSQLLVESPADLYQFIDTHGGGVYYRNLLLINLALCPRLLANIDFIHRTLAQPVAFSKDQVMDLIKHYKVNGLLTEFADLIPPFMNLT